MKYIYFFLILVCSSLYSQNNFSENWQDLYSYNDVKDFVIVDNNLLAITENAMFIADIDANTTRKFSSVNGLFGGITSAIGFDKNTNTTLIGYENGLIELISETNQVVSITGVRDNSILVSKEVKGFFFDENSGYVYGDFGIIEIDVLDAELGSSFKLSSTSLPNKVNRVVTKNTVLYAATDVGLYSIDTALNPVLFGNWNKLTDGIINNLIVTDKVLFSKGSQLFSVSSTSVPLIIEGSEILNLTEINDDSFTITIRGSVGVYDVASLNKLDAIAFSSATSHVFETDKAIVRENELFVKTSNYGVLKTEVLGDKSLYTEIHPEGPSSNNPYSITRYKDQTWIVYGGVNQQVWYSSLNKLAGIDYYYKGKWNHISTNDFDGSRDLTNVLVFENDVAEPTAFVSSYRSGSTASGGFLRDRETGGVLEFDTSTSGGDTFKFNKRWNFVNTDGKLARHSAVRSNWVADLVMDNNGNVWAANVNALGGDFFSKYDVSSGEWSETATFTMDLPKEGGVNRYTNNMHVDGDNLIFAPLASNGIFVFDANSSGARRTAILNANMGLKEENSSKFIGVRSVLHEDGVLWVGTAEGLYTLRGYGDIFNPTTSLERLIIEENGFAREFLADIPINDMLIDNSGNKWFGTRGGGVVYTSSDAQTTFEIFNQANSPLPSNNIQDLELDKETGRIYIVTDKGVVSFNPNSDSSSLFGDKITEIVAYPNPAIANKVGHSTIKIVAKGGGGLPEDTNVKIMDVSGKLVFEKNVKVTDANGGVVVWNKKNLSGNLVVSGVYIVLVSSPDGQENATTKIAIVN